MPIVLTPEAQAALFATTTGDVFTWLTGWLPAIAAAGVRRRCMLGSRFSSGKPSAGAQPAARARKFSGTSVTWRVA